MPTTKGCKRVSFPLLPMKLHNGDEAALPFFGPLSYPKFGAESITPWVECQARGGEECCKRGAHSPPCKGGVAGAVIISREASEAPQTGWSLTRNLTCKRPPRPRLIGTGPIFLMARPPLLCKEGNVLACSSLSKDLGHTKRQHRVEPLITSDDALVFHVESNAARHL